MPAAAMGELVAVNVNTATSRGRCPSESQTVCRKENTIPEGREWRHDRNRGWAVFVGATDDARFRAFDAKTGKELWHVNSPARLRPRRSRIRGRDGKQYVVITSTGGGFVESGDGDSVIAFALDESK